MSGILDMIREQEEIYKRGACEERERIRKRIQEPNQALRDRLAEATIDFDISWSSVRAILNIIAEEIGR